MAAFCVVTCDVTALREGVEGLLFRSESDVTVAGQLTLFCEAEGLQFELTALQILLSRRAV